MTEKKGTRNNPDWDPDALVEFALLPAGEGGKTLGVSNGYRPQYLINDDYLTSTDHFFIDSDRVKLGHSCNAFVRFITPEAYPHTLSVGRRIKVQEGSRLVGHATVIEIYNDELNKDRQQEAGA